MERMKIRILQFLVFSYLIFFFKSNSLLSMKHSPPNRSKRLFKDFSKSTKATGKLTIKKANITTTSFGSNKSLSKKEDEEDYMTLNITESLVSQIPCSSRNSHFLPHRNCPLQKFHDFKLSVFSLIDYNHKIIMEFSPKSSCTAAVVMFLKEVGYHYGKHYSGWPHSFRDVYYNKKCGKATVCHYQANDWFRFKIVRNPFDRVISSFIHFMRVKELHEKLLPKTINQLKIMIEEQERRRKEELRQQKKAEEELEEQQEEEGGKKKRKRHQQLPQEYSNISMERGADDDYHDQEEFVRDYYLHHFHPESSLKSLEGKEGSSTASFQNLTQLLRHFQNHSLITFEDYLSLLEIKSFRDFPEFAKSHSGFQSQPYERLLYLQRSHYLEKQRKRQLQEKEEETSSSILSISNSSSILSNWTVFHEIVPVEDPIPALNRINQRFGTNYSFDFHSKHYVKKIASHNQSYVGNLSWYLLKDRIPKNYGLFYHEEIRLRVQEIFAWDLLLYNYSYPYEQSLPFY